MTSPTPRRESRRPCALMYHNVSSWGDYAPDDVVHRRAGGRRAYNARRRDEALLRRSEVARLSLHWSRAHSPLQRGKGAWIARQLGVSEATISRDLAAIRALWLESYHRRT